MRYWYVVVSLLFAMIVTMWFSFMVKGALFYVSFLAYIPYAVTVFIRFREYRKKKEVL